MNLHWVHLLRYLLSPSGIIHTILCPHSLQNLDFGVFLVVALSPWLWPDAAIVKHRKLDDKPTILVEGATEQINLVRFPTSKTVRFRPVTSDCRCTAIEQCNLLQIVKGRRRKRIFYAISSCANRSKSRWSRQVASFSKVASTPGIQIQAISKGSNHRHHLNLTIVSFTMKRNQIQLKVSLSTSCLVLWKSHQSWLALQHQSLHHLFVSLLTNLDLNLSSLFSRNQHLSQGLLFYAIVSHQALHRIVKDDISLFVQADKVPNHHSSIYNMYLQDTKLTF